MRASCHGFAFASRATRANPRAHSSSASISTLPTVSFRPYESPGFWRTTDSRGYPRSVNVLSPHAWGSVPAEAQLPLATWFACIVIVGTMCIAFAVHLARNGNPMSIAPLLFLLMAFVASGGWLFRAARTFPDRAAARLLDRGRCPTCMYDLSALTPERDGCTVCPECGAAWRRTSASE